MNRLANWMMRLYPARWRARYGDEMRALLADTGADARVVADLFKGGVRMQFKTWSFPKLALTLGIVGAVLGVGVGLMLPNTYISRATMQITPVQVSETMPQPAIGVFLNRHIQQMETSILSHAGLSAIIQDPRLDLYKEERKTTPLEDVIEEMKQNIGIQFITLPGALGRQASAFDITFSYYDRYKAQQVVQALMNKFEEANQSQQKTRANDNQLLVLESASWPASPSPAKKGMAAVYRSNATVALPQGVGPDRLSALQAVVFSRGSLSAVINSRQLVPYRDQLRTQPLDDAIQAMKQHLVVTPIHFRDLTFFDVSFDCDDPYKAQQTVSMIVRAFTDAESRMFPDINLPPPAFTPEVLEVLDVASLPVRPASPNRNMIAFAGGILGIVAAAFIAAIRRLAKPQDGFPKNAIPE